MIAMNVHILYQNDNFVENNQVGDFDLFISAKYMIIMSHSYRRTPHFFDRNVIKCHERKHEHYEI